MDPVALFIENISAFQQQFSNTFLQMGKNMFTSITLILIVFFGWESMMNGEGFSSSTVARYVRLLLWVVGIAAILNNYASFLNVLTGEGEVMRNMVRVDLRNEVAAQVLGTMKQPGVLDLQYALIYMTVYLCNAIFEIILFVALCFPFLAMGILAMLGPVFIPLALVPKLDMLAWNWLFLTVQYSFVPLVISAAFWVIQHLLAGPTMFRFMNQSPESAVVTSLAWITFLIGSAISLWKIPGVIGGIFGGAGVQTTSLPLYHTYRFLR